jgi:hypothetical protein
MLADQPSIGGILTGKRSSSSSSGSGRRKGLPTEVSSWALHHQQYNDNDSIGKWQTHLKQSSNWTELDLSGNNTNTSNKKGTRSSSTIPSAEKLRAADINTNIVLKHATPPSSPIKSPSSSSSSSSSSSVLMMRSRTTSSSSQELIPAALPSSTTTTTTNNNNGIGIGRRPVTDAYNHNNGNLDTKSSLTILPLVLTTPPKPSFGSSNSGNGRGGGGGGETPEDRAKRRSDYLAQIMKEQNMASTLTP